MRPRPIAVAALLVALTAGAAVAPGAAGASSPPNHPCRVQLRDTPNYRTVPLPPSEVPGYVGDWLLKGYVDWDAPGWPNRGSLEYGSCQPTRLIMVGDSLPFSIGIPILNGENRYGVELANASDLGCAFNTRGQLYARNEQWTSIPSSCDGVAAHWARVAGGFHAQAVIVMLGYRDEFNWRIAGRVVHLGDRGFDSSVKSDIEDFVNVVGNHGRRKILFLSIPFAQPRNYDGSLAAPAADPNRRRVINSLIDQVAAQHPGQVAIFNTDSVVSPGNHYDQRVNGNNCRSDGIHFTTYCSLLLQPKVFNTALKLVGS